MLEPKEYTYQCPTSKEVFSRFYRPTGAIPRYTKCRCGNPHAKLIFDNELQLAHHQKQNLRGAGIALERASNMGIKDPMFTSELKRAGEYLKELP